VAVQATLWPAAVSSRVAARLHAAPRPATVLATFPTALYLRLDDHADVLAVVTRHGLRLPTSLALATGLPWVGWGVQPGDAVVVGEGEVRLPGATVRAVRTWHPWRCPVAPGRFARAWLHGLEPDLGSLPWREPATRLAKALVGGEPVTPAVEALVGAGPGLTPSGDDVLCGVLLGLRLAGLPTLRRSLWTEVAPRLGSTTSLSAALLTEAAAGYAVPPVGRFVDVLVARDRDGVRAAAAQVRAIGHTSGADLLGGLVGALYALQDNGSHVFTMNRSVP
jgi:Protein of unknown function (DUF2877)